jgi:hypothetical protein
MPTPACPHDQTPDPWGRRIVIDEAEHSYADQVG